MTLLSIVSRSRLYMQALTDMEVSSARLRDNVRKAERNLRFALGEVYGCPPDDISLSYKPCQASPTGYCFYSETGFPYHCIVCKRHYTKE